MAVQQSKHPVKKALRLPPRAPSLRVKSIFMQKSKYKHLMKDQNVYRWFRKLLRRSPASDLGLLAHSTKKIRVA